MKKTAVEWLQKKLWQNNILTSEELELFEQAKEIEKQQIIDAHGNQTKKSGGVSNYTYILTGEEYYNETFKNN
jgi:hypothetical protein